MQEAGTDGTIRFDIWLVDGFVLTEYAAIVDVMRLANRLLLKPKFEWQSLSANGGPIACPADAVVQTTPLPPFPDAAYLIVPGNCDPGCPGLSVGRVIDIYLARQAKVVLLAEAASRYIADKGNHALTTHWENRAILQEQIGLHSGNQTLATEQGQIITSAGMGSTVDVMLTILARHISIATVTTVADILLHDRIRDMGTLQPFGGKSIALTGDAQLDRCIELMQANLEEPLPIAHLVQLVGVSSRSLERRFRQRLGMRPAEYYRALRLNRANNLLLNTSLPINEIALACGFPSGFTPHYRAHFGVTPQTVRQRKRAGAKP